MMVFEDTLTENKLQYFRKGFEIIDGLPVKKDAEFENIEFDNTQPLEIELKSFCGLYNKKKELRALTALMQLKYWRLSKEHRKI